MNEIQIKTREREVLIDITSEVAELVASAGSTAGVCTIFSRHTTCGLTINENADPDVRHDILLFLRELIPQYFDGFRHFEHNSDAHIKTSLMGSSVSVPYENGVLLLGRWQGIYLCEFDGPKTRTVLVSV
ncbi:MAG: secondary thiamine-phosphate synthase enzyme YjbQ [Acidobacteriota bacterium]|nr:secondary thiamine-phosphate synthase enzyme YjbQ [Acidobacteriota bacterium]